MLFFQQMGQTLKQYWRRTSSVLLPWKNSTNKQVAHKLAMKTYTTSSPEQQKKLHSSIQINLNTQILDQQTQIC